MLLRRVHPAAAHVRRRASPATARPRPTLDCVPRRSVLLVDVRETARDENGVRNVVLYALAPEKWVVAWTVEALGYQGLSRALARETKRQNIVVAGCLGTSVLDAFAVLAIFPGYMLFWHPLPHALVVYYSMTVLALCVYFELPCLPWYLRVSRSQPGSLE